MPAPLTIRAIESRVLTADNGPRYDQTAGLPSVRDAGARAPASAGPFPGRDDRRHICYYPPTRNVVIVKITAGDGQIGWGECLTPVAPRVAHTIIEELLAPMLIGADAREIELLWERMFSTMRLRSHDSGHTTEAMSGIDIALWDLLGHYREEPVWRLLGGAYRRRLPVYASGVPGQTNEERLASLEELVQEKGFSAVKLSVGNGTYAEQRNTVAAVSAALGERGRLLVDVHGTFDLADARRFAAFLEELGNVEWLEEALLPDDHDAYAELTASTTIRIAVGETDTHRAMVRERVVRRGCDVVLPDVCRAAGITGTARMARLADTFGVAWASHVSVGTELHNAAGLHIGAATPNFLVSEYPYRYAEGPFGLALTPGMKRPIDGWIDIGEEPGLGVEVSEDGVDNLTVQRQLTALE